MDTTCFENLLDKVSSLICRKSTSFREAIPAAERLALTLRFLASGETQTSLSFQFRIAQCTISGILQEVCKAIYSVLRDEYLPVPSVKEEWEEIANDFFHLWNFPMCIGALDGKHIKIVPPPGSGSKFFNYKGDFSLVLLALVDASMKFTYVDIGTNGRMSDGGVWAKCTFKRALDSNSLSIPEANALPGTNIKVPYVIVADDAFPLTTAIMKPYPGRILPNEKRIFNYRLSRARRVAENAFGILAARFQMFKSPIASTPANIRNIVLAACSLHNFLRQNAISLYAPIESVDREDLESTAINPGNWRDCPNNMGNLLPSRCRGDQTAKLVQEMFCSFFNTVGAVPWQQEMCNFH